MGQASRATPASGLAQKSASAGSVRAAHGRLTAPNVEAILDELDDAAGSPAAGKNQSPRARNRARRVPYRHPISISIEHPGGGIVKFEVTSRNLSAGGVALLSSAFIHPGSSCWATLLTPKAEKTVIEGIVAHCHLVRGRIHEVGVRFSTPVVVEDFIAPESIPQLEIDPASLQGRVLLLEDSALEQMLFKHCIQETKVQLTSVQTASEALAELEKKSCDIFVSDLYLESGSQDGIAVIKKARASGFQGPIILVTAETSEERQAEGRQAGADYVMSKPYKPGALIAMLQRAHQDCGAVVSNDLLVWTHGQQSEAAPFLKAFTAEAELHGKEIHRLLAAEDLPGLRRVCLSVKTGATGVGYMALAGAVDSALALLTNRALAHARPVLIRIATACQTLAGSAKSSN